jgi:hypothetical protein
LWVLAPEAEQLQVVQPAEVRRAVLLAEQQEERLESCQL